MIITIYRLHSAKNARSQIKQQPSQSEDFIVLNMDQTPAYFNAKIMLELVGKRKMHIVASMLINKQPKTAGNQRLKGYYKWICTHPNHACY